MKDHQDEAANKHFTQAEYMISESTQILSREPNHTYHKEKCAHDIQRTCQGITSSSDQANLAAMGKGSANVNTFQQHQVHRLEHHQQPSGNN